MNLFLQLSLTSLCILFFSSTHIFGQSIPTPALEKNQTGRLVMSNKIVVTVNSNTLDFEKKYLENLFNRLNKTKKRKFENSNSISIHLILNKKIKSKNDEAYTMSITPKGVEIKADYATGIFRGITTFIQMYVNSDGELTCRTIKDEPKFAWRGMHLDVSRHFYSVEFIKKYIDLLALYKMNVFHWHLTDDQGWRIEIKKYPKLTEVGAWRNGTMVGPYSNQEYDTLRYGGFYTQEDIKEVVHYAAQRHITVVPEIEMPGHALAALASYPEYSCTRGPFEVGKGWGVFDDVFCAREETFAFLEDILSEVIELFPSKVIHIGGDECPKARWKACEHCQKTMRDNQLKDEHELQSYFIQRMEKFLISKGRKLIGWDEILEGGLAPEAMVMSWHGTEGGIAAAKMKHYAVMSPGSHCYFDHYQGDPRHEPLAFGGYTPLEKVYSFNPIPAELTKEEAKYILGGQANVWTEYISGTVRMGGHNIAKELNFWKDNMTPEQHVEYMVLPRLLALSEALWGTTNPKNYDEFLQRVIQHKKNILEPLKYNYSNSIYEIKMHVFARNNELYAELTSPLVKEINVSLDLYRGSVVSDGENSYLSTPYQLYQEPIRIAAKSVLEFYHDFDGIYASRTDLPYSMKRMAYSQRFHINKATAKPIQLVHEPHKNYSFGGAFSLVNGMRAARQHLGKDWLGFSGTDLIATIDLLEETEISKLGIGFLERQGSWIYYPKEVHFEISMDGEHFTTAYAISASGIEADTGQLEIKLLQVEKARFVRITALNYGQIPDGMPGGGNKAWLFVDEILVD